MWSYFGAKSILAKYYPKPKYSDITEYFAGTARYSLLYFDRDITLVDKYDVIIRIWKFLQQCSPNDILSLKHPGVGKRIIFKEYDCIEMGWLLGFMIARVRMTPSTLVSSFGAGRFNSEKKRIAGHLYKIKHWKLIHGSYEDIPNKKGTHFIDAPYQFGGAKYKEGSLKIDFNSLGDWCMDREGQTIVCENTKADWLPFVPMVRKIGIERQTTEAIWTNEPTHYNNIQTNLFHEQL